MVNILNKDIMKNKREFLDVDYIGGLGSLTKEDEQKLSEYFKNKKKSKSNEIKGRIRTKSKSEKV
ncbi:MAG: hypothetical protein IPL35_05795 [Sphingobacteriales bacterium]|nr:hypothetical protein [Sphingobacteriales bacterium]